MTFTNDPPVVASVELIPDSDEKADLDAPAGSGGKLVIGQAPNITITETNVVADAAERLALDVQEGDVAIQTNVSSSFIFTGGDNIAPNWEVLDFDAVGAIQGEDIDPRDITARVIDSSLDITGVNMELSGTFNGANFSGAAAGEALTSDGSGNLSFASVGGIEEASTFGDLPAIDPPQIGFVTSEGEYYYSKPLSGLFDLDFATFTDSINAQDSPSSIDVNDDGSKLYELGRGSKEIYQYTLSTAFDITTASLEKSVNTGLNNPDGFAWNNDGTQMYVGSRGEGIGQYSLSTAYDIGTAVLDIIVPAQDDQTTGIAWNNDGSRFYEVGRVSEKIFQLNVSTSFDLTTATLDTSIQRGPDPKDIEWNNDGSRFFEVDSQASDITQFSVSTPFDISTAAVVKSITPQDSIATGIAFNDNGSKLYESGDDQNKIYQYTVGSGGWEVF